jgi:hypothetical protein
MLKLIIDLLQADEWLEAGEAVQIAKGKNKIPQNWKEIKSHFKRVKNGRR